MKYPNYNDYNDWVGPFDDGVDIVIRAMREEAKAPKPDPYVLRKLVHIWDYLAKLKVKRPIL